MSYDTWLATDTIGEQAEERQYEINRVIDQAMGNPAELMESIGADAYDVLYEIVAAMTLDREAGEDAGDWIKRRYFAAEAILLRRARHYAEGVVE